MRAFYADAFELALLNKEAADPNYYLSDGRICLMIMPWRITDHVGMDPAKTGPEHIGFKVESVDAVKVDIDDLLEQNPHMKLGPWALALKGRCGSACSRPARSGSST